MERFKITVENTEHEEELVRTVTALFGTKAGSQPADRDFGISWECLDDIPEVAENLFYLEAVQKVEKYEPRVQIRDIVFARDNGVVTARIFFTGKGAE